MSTLINNHPIQGFNINDLVETTNAHLAKWYEDVRRDYGVEGYAECRLIRNADSYEDGTKVHALVIRSVENGKKQTHSLFACDEHIQDHMRAVGIKWLFNIWSEGAMPELGAALSQFNG